MTISLDNVAEVFKSERTSLVETIILQHFFKFKTTVLSKVLRRIRDDKKIKCERIAFNNCNFQNVCPKLFCTTLSKMSFVYIGDRFGTKITYMQISLLLWMIILNSGCRIMDLDYDMKMILTGPRRLLATVTSKLKLDRMFGKVKTEFQEQLTQAHIASVYITGLRPNITFEGREEEYEKVKDEVCREAGLPREMLQGRTGLNYIRQLDGNLRRVY